MISSKKNPEPIKKTKQLGRTVYQKELQQIRDTCTLLKQLSTATQNEAKFRRGQDFEELKVWKRIYNLDQLV